MRVSKGGIEYRFGSSSRRRPRALSAMRSCLEQLPSGQAVEGAARPEARRSGRSRRCGRASRTRMRSASRMVLRRWAMTMRVAFIAAMLAPTVAWVRLSSALVASSKKIRRGRLTRARAIITRWRWPPEIWPPPSITKRVEAHRHGGDVGLEAGQPDRFDDLVARQRRAAGDVLVEAAGNQAGRFQHGADLAAHQPEVERLEVLAVVVDAAARRRLEARAAGAAASTCPSPRGRRWRRSRPAAPRSRRPPAPTVRPPHSGTTGCAPRRARRAGRDRSRLCSTSSGASNTGRQAGEERHHLDRDVERLARLMMRRGELAEGAVEGGEGGDIDRVVAAGGDAEDADGAEERQARGGDGCRASSAAATGRRWRAGRQRRSTSARRRAARRRRRAAWRCRP